MNTRPNGGEDWQSEMLDFRPDSVRLAPNRTWLDKLEFVFACAAVFLSPINFLRHPAIYVTLGDVFALACLLILLAKRTLPARPFGSGTAFWIVGLILLIGGLFISSLVNGSAYRGLVVSGQYFVAYFVMALVILSRPRWQVVILVKLFLLSILIMCVHGAYLIQIAGEVNTRFVTGNGRLMSFVERENECASLFAMTFPLLFWLGGTGGIRRTVFWICIPILTYGVLLTGSNTGLLAMTFACFTYFLLTSITSWRRLTTGLASAAALVVLLAVLGATFGRAVLPPAFQQRVLGALESGDINQAGTFTYRYHLILEAQEMVNNSILLGLGADRHHVASQWGRSVHNAYLLIWSEGGLFALIGMLLIILAGFWVIPTAARQAGGWTTAVCTFCAVSLFAMLINAVPHVYGRFWTVPVFLAVAASLAHVSENAITRFRTDPLGGRFPGVDTRF